MAVQSLEIHVEQPFSGADLLVTARWTSDSVEVRRWRFAVDGEGAVTVDGFCVRQALGSLIDSLQRWAEQQQLF